MTVCTASIRVPGFIAALALLLAATTLPAQEEAQQDTSATTAEEDLSWQDKSVRQLRREYRDAEDAFYDAFNEVNTDDEFDMDCKNEPELGSRRRVRRCQAEFLWDYEEELGEEMYRRSSTGGAGMGTTSMATLQRKQDELRAEMNAAIRDYPKVGAAFAELNRTKRRYELKLAEE